MLLLVGAACNVYTPDLLRSSAGESGISKGGASVQAGGASTTAQPSTPAGGGRDSVGSAGHPSGGLGASPGTNSGGTIAAGGSASSGAGSFGAAGNSSGAGSASTGGTSAEGGGSSIVCLLDDMKTPDALAPLLGCDSSRVSRWESYLPSAQAISSGAIQPPPGQVFARADASDEDKAALGDVRWVSTVSGRVVVSDNKKYFGVRFPLFLGPSYAARGMVLHFYYRTQYSAPIEPLRVNLPIPATTFSGDPGGTCSVNCGNHFGANVPNTGGNWNQWSLRIESTKAQGDLSQIWEPAVRDIVTFDVNQILWIEFGTSTPQQFELSIGPVWLEWKIAPAS